MIFSNGALSGTPIQTGSFPITIKATDVNGCIGMMSYTLVINCQTITVNPATIPSGMVGKPYNQPFTHAGGIGTVAFNLNAGALPTGLSLSSVGVLSGTSTQSGSFPITIKATDANGCMGMRDYTLVIGACPAIALNPTPLPNGTLGAAYNQTLSATGGAAPYTFALMSGTLPPGLSLAANGVISGIPTQIGSSTFTVKATDANGCMGMQQYTVTINSVGNARPTISAVAVSRQQGSPASNSTIANVGDANQAANTLTVAVNNGLSATVNGVTISSLSVNAAGVVTANVAAACNATNASFTLTVTDSAPTSVNATLNVTVANNAPPVLTYGNQSVVAGGSLTINPATGPSDNGALSSIVVQNQGGYTGTISINGSTGVISLSGAKPTGTHTITIRATDNCGATTNSPFTLTVTCPALMLSPPTLPDGKVGISYNPTLTVSGGGAPYTFALMSGALPPGLTLAANGAISGTPTTAATFSNIVIKATDANNCTGMHTYSITINPAPCPTITVNPATLPNGTRGAPYNQTLTATGGVASYHFAVTAGALPSGLALSSNGALSGTPTVNGSFNFTAAATDVNGCTGSRAYTLVIIGSCPAITLNPGALPAGAVGSAYSQTITASGGTAPHTFSVSTGALPAGLTLSSAGTLSGTPTQSGNFNLTIQSTDAKGCMGTKPYTLTINPRACPTITVNPATLPVGTVGSIYNQTFTQTGGSGAIGFSLDGGSLPPGLSLTPSGGLSGTPTQSGNFNFTVKATDANNCIGNRSYTLTTVNPRNADLMIAISASPGTVSNGTKVTYNITLTNKGPGDASQVVVTDNLPAPVSFISCSATNGGVCNGSGNNRTVTFASIPQGASAAIKIEAIVNCTNVSIAGISNTVSVSSAIPDQNPADNSATAMVNAAPGQAKLTLSNNGGAFDFGTVTLNREPNPSSTSYTFTLENTGCTPVAVTLAINRTGADVSSGKITRPDDSATFPITLINNNGTEIPMVFVAGSVQLQINGGQQLRFRIAFNPMIPAPAGGVSSLSAGHVLPPEITSALTIRQDGGAQTTVPLIGRISTLAKMINPLATRLSPLVALARSGDEFVTEFSVFDSNLDCYLAVYQFLDSLGRAVGDAPNFDLEQPIRQSGMLKGQSFTIVKRFTGAASRPQVNKVRVTLYDREGNESVLSGEIGKVIGRVVNVSAASFQEAGLASEAITSAFGSNLAASTQIATSSPLPMSLAGARVFVRDSANVERPAPLFFVAPGQINYQIPRGTATGSAVVTVANGDEAAATGTVQITQAFPGLFAANANGQGVAAAVALRVRADGSQSYEPVSIFDQAQNKFVSRQISFGPESDQLYLVLFGTGIRNRGSLSSVTAKIGGLDAPVLYAGSQGGFVGLDQVNLRLPRSLAGRGEVDIVLTAEGKPSNIVKVSIY